MNKINFTLYSDNFELINTIKTTKKRNDFIGKILDFYFLDIEPNFKENSYEKIVWNNISPSIKGLKVKALNGSKGGRPKKNKESKSKTETKTETESKTESESKSNYSYSNSYSNNNSYSNSVNKIIDRLNNLNNTKYRTNSDNTIKLIKARLDDGYTEDDLLMVVEKMSYIWGSEPKKGEKDMRPYLRPSTLFRKSNFENYLNMPVRKKELTTADLAETMNFEGFFD